MKILHVINNLNKGGAERLLVDILPFYIKNGQYVELLQISDLNSSKDYITSLRQEKVLVTSLSLGSLYNLNLILKLRSYIKKHNYDVVHVHLFPSMYWASIAFKLIKSDKRPALVFTEHSTQNNRLNNPVFRPIDKFIYKSYNAVIAISEAIQTKLSNWIGNDNKITLIRNGINVSRFENAILYDRTLFSNMFGIPTNGIILLMTARFHYPKDHLTLVNALKYLSPNFYLIFAGEGDEKSEIQKMVIENGLESRVIFAGFRSDAASIMKSVDYNILSSRYEGMSGVTLEALAAGKPFLGSDVPGINDIVPDKRFLFEMGNAISLANSIKQIDNDETLRKQMIADGIAFVQKFDVSIMIEKHIALYEGLIRSSKNKSTNVQTKIT